MNNSIIFQSVIPKWITNVVSELKDITFNISINDNKEHIINVSEWHNGREKGYVLWMFNDNIPNAKSMICVIAQDRIMTDNIIVMHWEDANSYYLNAPTVNNLSDKTYKNAIYFNEKNIQSVKIYVQGIFEKFIEKTFPKKNIEYLFGVNVQC